MPTASNEDTLAQRWAVLCSDARNVRREVRSVQSAPSRFTHRTAKPAAR